MAKSKRSTSNIPSSLPDSLRAAYEASKKLPPGWRKQSVTGKRLSYLRQRLEEKPYMTHNEAKAILKKDFGVGVSFARFNRIRDEVKRSLEHRARRSERASITSNGAPPVKQVQAANPNLNEHETVKNAAKALLRVLPNIAKFELTVGDDGKTNIKWSVREVNSLEFSEE